MSFNEAKQKLNEAIAKIDNYISAVVSDIFNSRFLRLDASKLILDKYADMLKNYTIDYISRDVHGLRVGFKRELIYPISIQTPTLKASYKPEVGGRTLLRTEEGTYALPAVPVFVYEPVDGSVIDKITRSSQEAFLLVRFPPTTNVSADYENAYGKYITLRFSHTSSFDYMNTLFDGREVMIMGSIVTLRTFTSPLMTTYNRVVKIDGVDRVFDVTVFNGKYTCESRDEFGDTHTFDIECTMLVLNSTYTGQFEWLIGSRPIRGNNKYVLLICWGSEYYLIEL